MQRSEREQFIYSDLIRVEKETTTSLVLSLFESYLDISFETIIEKTKGLNKKIDIENDIFQLLVSERITFSMFYEIIAAANFYNMDDISKYYSISTKFKGCDTSLFLYYDLSIIDEAFNSYQLGYYELKNRRPNLNIYWETIILIKQLSQFIFERNKND